MILDAQSLLSDDQAITATAVSTNVIDFGTTGTPVGGAVALSRDIGAGMPVPLLVQVTEDFNTLTSLTISVEVSAAENFSSARTVASTGAVPLASLTTGYQAALATVPLTADERYLRLSYAVAGTNPTAGKITAGLTTGIQTNV